MKLPSYQELSKEQDRINDLPLSGRHLVVGPPGTGKTVMALYRAVMLNKRRRKVKLLMYSRLLMQYTQNAADELLLDGTIDTFTRWFYMFYWKNYRERPPETEPYRYDFNAALPRINSSPPKDDVVSDLIVDEGQDLPKEFYLLTPLISTNVIVFADENQRITDWCSTIDEIRAYGAFGEAHALTRNYRNTREIADLAATFYTGLRSGIPDPPERRGEVPVVRGFTDLAAWAEFLLTHEANNPDRTIGVFVPTLRLQRRIVHLLGDRPVNPVQMYEGGKGAKGTPVTFDNPGIIVVNYKSAKGLEFDTVFLPELQEVAEDLDSPDIRMKFYVLVSRARENLHLSYSGLGEPHILQLIPRHLVDFR